MIATLGRTGGSAPDGLALAGHAGLAIQVALAMADGSPPSVAAGSLSLAVLLLSALGVVRFGGTIRESVNVAGLGGLAMFAGPGLDLLLSRPPGTHAAGSLLLMSAVCWWICGRGEHGSRRRPNVWALPCRIAALAGMLLGMVAAHVVLGHEALHTRDLAFVHLAMVGSMTAGSGVAVAAVSWIRGLGSRLASVDG